AGRPDEPGRLQASLRGCDAERRRSAGLLGDRTRSFSRLAPEHHRAEAPEVPEPPEITHARLELLHDAPLGLDLRLLRQREVVPQQLNRKIGILFEEARALVAPGREVALGPQVLDDRTPLETPYVRLEDAGGVIPLPLSVQDGLRRQPSGEQRHRGALVVERPAHEPGGPPSPPT